MTFYNVKNESDDNSEQKRPILRLVITFSIVILLATCAIVAVRGYNAYHHAIEEGRQNANRLTHTLSDHIRLTFLAGDMTLKRAIDRQYFNTLFGNNIIDYIRNNFRIWVNETPQISAMLMTDENGDIQAIHRKTGYKTWMGGKENVKGLEFFTQHINSPDPDLLYVGWQNSWIADHDGFVILSRRISSIDGKFNGVVAIAINSDYVNSFFKSIESNKHTKLILLRDDGKKLISHILDKNELGILSQIMRANNIASQPSQVRTFVDDTKGRLRQFSFDRIPNLHMILAIISYDQDIFAPWWADRINDLVFLGIFTIFIVVIYLFAAAGAKQMQLVKNSEAAAVMASQSKSDFLANMSHELRTPLNAVIGFSEMIAAEYFGKLNAKQKERVNDIHSCGTHLLELINDVLEFSKGEAGKMELYPEKISIYILAKDAVNIFAERTQGDEIRVVNSITPEIPLLVADNRKVKQILLNLLSNAVKFTDKGGVVDVTCHIDSDGNLVLTVSDTGDGIAEHDIPKALSTFGQTHNSLTKGGTGLGLPLCKMFAELHGGRLEIQSAVGVGTKVSIIFPANLVVQKS